MARAATKAPSKKASGSKAPAKAPPKASKKAAAVPAAKAASKSSAKPAKKSAKASSEKVTILTLRHIAERISELHEMPKRQANDLLTQVVEMITKSLKKGEKIRLSGLGILQVRKRAARMGRNPQTGEPVKIKASKKIAFRAAKDLKDSI
jgi:DNA-binding protein HU-beta